MQEGLTFDDVLLIPQYSEILPSEVNTASFLSRNVPLRVPIVSSPMDTVTEHKMAIAMALTGGIGIIHKNLSVEEQVHEVDIVKRFENGFIFDPITVSPSDTIDDVHNIRMEKGYKKIPVVDKKGILIGLITELGYFWPSDKKLSVKKVMMPLKDLTVAPVNTSLAKANDIIYKKKLNVLCLVDKQDKLVAIVTRKDLEKNETYPNANKDKNKSLFVGAAVGVGDSALERARELVKIGVDAITVDTAHGHSLGVIEMVKTLKKDKITKDVDVIAGNIATAAAAKALTEAGVDGLKVGIGPASICTTRIVAGVGVPQITAVQEATKGRDSANVKKGKNYIPIIADGGIRYSGDIVKALAAGGDSIMIGNMFAGTDESPGETMYYHGKMYKSYRGMGSLAAMARGSKDRYGQKNIKETNKLVPEGIEGRIAYCGPIDPIIYQLVGGVRSGMGYLGARTVKDLHKKAEFVKVTNAGLKENHPHDVEIAKQAPNYS